MIDSTCIPDGITPLITPRYRIPYRGYSCVSLMTGTVYLLYTLIDERATCPAALLAHSLGGVSPPLSPLVLQVHRVVSRRLGLAIYLHYLYRIVCEAHAAAGISVSIRHRRMTGHLLPGLRLGIGPGP
jgi:hypothetical protein